MNCQTHGLVTNPIVQGSVQWDGGGVLKLESSVTSQHDHSGRTGWPGGIPVTMLKGLEDFHPGLRHWENQPLHLIDRTWEAVCLRRKQMVPETPGLLVQMPLPGGGLGEAAPPEPWLCGSWEASCLTTRPQLHKPNTKDTLSLLDPFPLRLLGAEKDSYLLSWR